MPKKLFYILNNIWSKVTSPFNEEAPMFLNLIFLSLPVPIFYILSRQLLSFGVHIFMLDTALAYIVVLLKSFISKYRTVANIYKYLVLILYVITFIINTFCIIALDTTLGLEESAKIIETNYVEGSSFLSMYISPINIIISIIACVICFVFVNSLKKFLPIRKFANNVISIVFFIAAIIFGPFAIKNLDIMDPKALAECVVLKPFIIYHNIDYYPSPDQMGTTDAVTKTSDTYNKIVIVIGESFARSHSSLYGYDKETNPKLKVLAESENVFVIKNVVSADTHTTDAFKKMMTIEESHKIWYEQNNIIDILQKGGYKVNWFSNQNKSGLHNNTTTCFSNLCDFCVYTNKSNNNYDFNLIPIIKSAPKNPSSVDFIHLMGSHEAFYNRYPSDSCHFSPGLYINHPAHQRKILSDYDNSIRYNDSFIDTLTTLYDSIPTIILYFPDHGMDIYDTNSNYAGHARRFSVQSDKICRQIPFIIYVNELYKEQNPRIIQRLHELNSETAPDPYNLNDLPYLIMDIAGIKFINNDDVKQKSLLSR